MGIKKREGFFYGWIIVAIATLSLVVSNGLSIGGIPVFYKFIQTDLVNSGAVDAGRIQSVYGLAPALTFIFAGLFAPVGGFLIARLNARTMMLIGCGILGTGLLVYSQAATELQVYFAHSLLGISLGFVGVLVNTVLISNWFLRKRGSALGIVLTGTSLGGATIPLIATPLIQTYQWRTALIMLSGVIWFLLLPAVIFFVKNKPEDVGQQPDGIPGAFASDETDKTTGIYDRGLTLAEALRTPVFWIFSICAALIFYAIFVVSQQLNLFLQSDKIGYSPEQASIVQSLLFFFSIGGKFLFGMLADKFAPNRVMLFSASTMFLSTLLFFNLNEQTIYLFAVLFGLTYGGTFVLLQLLVAEYFGLKEFGKILGVITVIETLGGAIGTIITGRIADAYGGDFTYGFFAVIGVTGAALLLFILLDRYFDVGDSKRDWQNTEVG